MHLNTHLCPSFHFLPLVSLTSREDSKEETSKKIESRGVSLGFHMSVHNNQHDSQQTNHINSKQNIYANEEEVGICQKHISLFQMALTFSQLAVTKVRSGHCLD